jgi:hypothetical protein
LSIDKHSLIKLSINTLSLQVLTLRVIRMATVVLSSQCYKGEPSVVMIVLVLEITSWL